MAILTELAKTSTGPPTWVILGALAVIAVYLKLFISSKRANLPIYSTHSGWLGSWHDSLDYLRDSPGVLKAGYERLTGQFSKHDLFYQLRTPVRWVIVVPPRFVDEIRTAPPTHLSAKVAANDFHFHLIKTHLTPNLEHKIGDLLDEINLAFDQEIGRPEDWKPVVMARTAHRIATRTANRLLVGAPLCRNEEYLQMSIRYTIDVFGGADKLRAWPDFLKRPVTYFVTSVNERQKVARKHLLPYIKGRLEEIGQLEKASARDKPVDSLQWVIDAAPNPLERDPERLMYRLLHLNVAAVHTTSVTFLNCVYDLALHTDTHAELREEVQRAVSEDGWTARGLAGMRKLDSFMLESQRLAPIASSQMTRAVTKDFTFSDGTTVPKGSYVLVPMHAMYLDDSLYPNASTFDAFRWSRLREQPGDENRYQFVTTSPTHINFGHGRDACPGRFFAAQEIKLLLAHILLHYDVRLEDSSALPTPTWYDRSRLPNQTARVLFRAR
ncbi:cytochrome P450 [Aspergillus pseudodeflectus]|uniref:Cytochrome P450 n=1 Tax=Aspergillus pseudodeflectus TaxID=176178 RepID=A0ABR4L4X7_9EURO